MGKRSRETENASPGTPPKKHKTHEKREKQTADNDASVTDPRGCVSPSSSVQTFNAKSQSNGVHAAVTAYDPSMSLKDLAKLCTAPSATDIAVPPLPPLPAGPYSTAPFTHSSLQAAQDLNYERLEFLGDAYLELIASRLIYARYPLLPPKRQTSLREILVRNRTLADFARAYAFDTRVRVDDPATINEKILGDVFEAYVAALVLADPAHGFAVAEAWLAALWAPVLLTRDAERAGAAVPLDEVVPADAKEALNRLLYTKPVQIRYEWEALRPGDAAGWESGALKQAARIGVRVRWFDEPWVHVGSALGVGKKEAGKLAAKAALDSIDREPMKSLAKRKRDHDRERKEANAKA